MKKNLIAVSALFLLAWGCDVRKLDKPADAPKISSADSAIAPTTVQIIDSVFNFGKIKEGEIVEHSFRFRNTGTEPLVVKQATATCGCTVPEKPEKPVAPGETGSIKVKFDSNGRPGQARKSVYVDANTIPPFPSLILEGDVIGKQ